MNEKLAINGGPKTINVEFAPYNSLGDEERLAVDKVMRSGILSQFLGVWHKDFFGGPKVQEFEKMAAKYFNSESKKAVLAGESFQEALEDQGFEIKVI